MQNGNLGLIGILYLLSIPLYDYWALGIMSMWVDIQGPTSWSCTGAVAVYAISLSQSCRYKRKEGFFLFGECHWRPPFCLLMLVHFHDEHIIDFTHFTLKCYQKRVKRCKMTWAEIPRYLVNAVPHKFNFSEVSVAHDLTLGKHIQQFAM